ncbi:spore germination protein [Tumebacillus algifaecis]|uniref:spore germination protein n=1 Tax=Tumebacillus algifaecis TaxID=1214604 RepID=UPI0012FD66C4|nr:spore germination protein [Tumebacillus algifaecis]
MSDTISLASLEKLGDFQKQSIRLLEHDVCFLFLHTLVDAHQTKQQLFTWSAEAVTRAWDVEMLLVRIEGEAISSDQLTAALVNGMAILQFPDRAQYIQFVPIRKKFDRSITESQTQSVVQGAQNSFTEDLNTNIALLRKQSVTPELIYRPVTLGTHSKRSAAMLYLEGTANPELVDQVWQAIQKGAKLKHHTSQSMLKTLQQKWWNPFPTVYSTELPHEATHLLQEGRVLVFLDQYPMAMAAPGLLQDAFGLAEDRNYPSIITYFFRIFRVIAFIIAITAPSLYVALIAVNPEVLRIQLALSIAQSREGVPYPALVEVLLMMLVMELVMEASVRLPKSIGPTVTMVGGIVLGQAVVQAQLVSNLLIIVISAMTIANFSIIGYQNAVAVRLVKYALLIITTIYGLIGMIVGVAWCIAFISGMTTFGIPYLSIMKVKEGSHE